jgi:hypothetical protein
MRNLTTATAAAPLLFMLACMSDATPTPAPVETSPDGLTIARHDTERVEGTYVLGASRVSFVANMIQEERADVLLTIGSKSVHVDIDYKSGFATHDANGAIFTAHDVALLETAAIALEEYMPTRPARTRVEDAVTQQLSFMAIAPTFIPLDKFDIAQDRSIVCIRCACQNQYIGSGYYRQAGQGWGCTGGSGNGCKGHCGASCSSNLSGNYTQDCAKHDYGLGSWAAASDDYSFGGCWCN